MDQGSGGAIGFASAVAASSDASADSAASSLAGELPPYAGYIMCNQGGERGASGGTNRPRMTIETSNHMPGDCGDIGDGRGDGGCCRSRAGCDSCNSAAPCTGCSGCGDYGYGGTTSPHAGSPLTSPTSPRAAAFTIPTSASLEAAAGVMVDTSTPGMTMIELFGGVRLVLYDVPPARLPATPERRRVLQRRGPMGFRKWVEYAKVDEWGTQAGSTMDHLLVPDDAGGKLAVPNDAEVSMPADDGVLVAADEHATSGCGSEGQEAEGAVPIKLKSRGDTDAGSFKNGHQPSSQSVSKSSMSLMTCGGPGQPPQVLSVESAPEHGLSPDMGAVETWPSGRKPPSPPSGGATPCDSPCGFLERSLCPRTHGVPASPPSPSLPAPPQTAPPFGGPPPPSRSRPCTVHVSEYHGLEGLSATAQKAALRGRGSRQRQRSPHSTSRPATQGLPSLLPELISGPSDVSKTESRAHHELPARRILGEATGTSASWSGLGVAPECPGADGAVMEASRSSRAGQSGLLKPSRSLPVLPAFDGLAAASRSLPPLRQSPVLVALHGTDSRLPGAPRSAPNGAWRSLPGSLKRHPFGSVPIYPNRPLRSQVTSTTSLWAPCKAPAPQWAMTGFDWLGGLIGHGERPPIDPYGRGVLISPVSDIERGCLG